MNDINFYGSIMIAIANETDRAQKMAELLYEWLKVERLNARMRMSGWEAVYENDDIYLYCYDAAFSSTAPGYLLEGKRQKIDRDEMRSWLEQLMRLCRRQLECQLEYIEVNEAGNEVSEEFSIDQYVV